MPSYPEIPVKSIGIFNPNTFTLSNYNYRYDKYMICSVCIRPNNDIIKIICINKPSILQWVYVQIAF